MKVKVRNNSRPFYNIGGAKGGCQILKDGEVIDDKSITWDNLSKWMIPIDDDGKEIQKPKGKKSDPGKLVS